MSVLLDTKGRAEVTFVLSSEKCLTVAQEQAITKALGFALEKHEFDAESFGDEDDADIDEAPVREPLPEVHYYSAEGEQEFDKRGWRIEGKLDLANILNALRSAGLDGVQVIVMHPNGYRCRCTPTNNDRFLSQLMAGSTIHQYEIAVAENGPRLLSFSYGYSNADLVRLSAPLAAVLLFPVLLALWMRRSYLRPEREPNSISVSSLRLLNLLSVVAPLSWLVAIKASTAGKLIVEMLGIRSSTFGMGGLWAVYLAPPLLVLAICYAVWLPVLKRARGGESSEESLRGLIVSLLATIVPLIILVGGIGYLILGDIRQGLLWLLVAYVARSLFLPALVKGSQIAGMVPLMVDGLRNRVFELAVKAGVTLREVYVVPAGKGRLPNAFATSGNTVLLSEDLIRKFSKREVDAIAAHEVAHLKSRHPQIKRTASIALLLVPTAISLSSRFFILAIHPEYLVLAGAILALLVHFYLSRRFEFAADMGSVALTGDAEALITALTRLGRLNFLPMNWGRLDEKLLTHPSTSRRVAELAGANGISPERLNELVNIPEFAEEGYSLTAAASTPRPPFSTTAKGNARPSSGTRSAALAPFVSALIWAAIAFLLAMGAGGMRAFLDRHSVSPLILAAAAGLIAFALKYYKIKRSLLRGMPQWIKIIATSPEQYPGLDIEALGRYTAELEALGFIMCGDYTFESDAKFQNLSAMGRLFVHHGYNCFAEVNQVVSRGIGMTSVGCSIMSALDDDWRLSSSNREPNGITYAHRSSKNLWTAHPGAPSAELLKAHLEWRNQIVRDLGLRISTNLSEQHYFSRVELTSKENRKAFKRKNVLMFLLDIDRFDRKPEYQWMGDHSKLSHRVPAPDTP